MRADIVRVLVPLALPSMLDYRWQGDTAPVLGQWVEMPVGRKPVHGVVAEILTESPFANLKYATPVENVPPLAPATLEFYRWAARYTLSAPGEPLRVALPKGKIPPLPKRLPKPKKISAKRDEVTLNPAQQQAADVIAASAHSFKPFLLDGVTGSGKTEVYFTVMEQLLSEGKDVLVLVPEIALTPQWLKRFEGRFGTTPLVWHSRLGEAARRRAWWQLQQNEKRGRVVVGARSSLFLPFHNLGMVVVDEEHEPSYKQEEAFRYHARDLAVQLAKLWQCPVVLASATPSLESWQRALDGKYQRLILPDRVGAAGMAPITLVDLRLHPLKRGDYLSQPLRDAMSKTLARGEQVLLFLNRRGNAPVLLCTSCGARRDCSRCDATLVVHGDKLQCHHCGLTESFPDECALCGSADLRPYGPGTRRVALEVQQHFPKARVAVADSDAVATPRQLSELVRALEDRTVDVVVGTQMITKGHHFPHLTCVGVVDADMGLVHGDLRAAERTFQLLTQVAGRAGRGDHAGRVLVQSYDPTQPLFQALQTHDRDGFYALELAARQAWGDPPFGKLVAVIVDGPHEHQVVDAARALAEHFPNSSHVRLLGPAPAPVAKIRDRHRWRLLIKGEGLLQSLIKPWVEQTPVPKSVRVVVDVDPVSFM